MQLCLLLGCQQAQQMAIAIGKVEHCRPRIVGGTKSLSAADVTPTWRW
jgi:hypothetical protein